MLIRCQKEVLYLVRYDFLSVGFLKKTFSLTHVLVNMTKEEANYKFGKIKILSTTVREKYPDLFHHMLYDYRELD
jgi:hypothetical protein